MSDRRVLSSTSKGVDVVMESLSVVVIHKHVVRTRQATGDAPRLVELQCDHCDVLLILLIAHVLSITTTVAMISVAKLLESLLDSTVTTSFNRTRSAALCVYSSRRSDGAHARRSRLSTLHASISSTPRFFATYAVILCARNENVLSVLVVSVLCNREADIAGSEPTVTVANSSTLYFASGATGRLNASQCLIRAMRLFSRIPSKHHATFSRSWESRTPPFESIFTFFPLLCISVSFFFTLVAVIFLSYVIS